MAHLSDLPGVTLDVAGTGEDLDACKREAEALGVNDRIRFLGRLPRTEVEKLYSEANLFLFPSFREPTGIVLLEAMRFGLPVVTTNLGGPGYIVTDSCGIRVHVQDPRQFALDLAGAVRTIAMDTEKLKLLSRGALTRIREIALWQNKISRMLDLYAQVARQEVETDALG
jgi:glycosyltransferase involved in cell wall biosynthesis